MTPEPAAAVPDPEPATAPVPVGRSRKNPGAGVTYYCPPGMEDVDPVIEAIGISKRFVTHSKRNTSLKERVVTRKRSMEHSDFWALKDVTVRVWPGETVGLIGPNGSGKSTLLKVISEILKPTTGGTRVTGRIASLLELGAGMNPELTGRENVYLNSALLGLSRKETDDLFDTIVDFSEVREFIDNQVKTYSSGMYVKLAFAVAVHTDPDVLLVDEVLSVGDEAFQRKCLNKIEEFQKAGKTILLVTHALDLVQTMCTRAIVLRRGEVQQDGDPVRGVGLLREILGTTVRPPDARLHSMEIVDIDYLDPLDLSPVSERRPGESVVVRVVVDVREIPAGNPLVGGDVRVLLHHHSAAILALHARGSDGVPARIGRHTVDITVDALPEFSGWLSPTVVVDDADVDPALLDTAGPDAALLLRRHFDHRLTVVGPEPESIFDVKHSAVARSDDLPRPALDVAAILVSDAEAGAAPIPDEQ